MTHELSPTPSPELTWQRLPWPQPALLWLHDAARCLALTQQGHLLLDRQGRLRPTAVQHLARASSLHIAQSVPRRITNSPTLSFLLRLLGQAGLIGSTGNTLRPTATAYDWLAQPANVQLGALRQVWWLTPELTWHWLPAGRRRRPLDSQWRFLMLETVHWLADLPPGAMIPLDHVADALAARGALSFSGPEQNLPIVRQATTRQAHALLDFLVQSVCPGLGLLELLDIEANGILSLSLTAEGRDWLIQALECRRQWDHPSSKLAVELATPQPDLALPRPTGPAVHVDAQLQVTVQLDALPSVTFEIGHFADLLTPGPPAVYQVSAGSLQQAASRGYSVADVHFLLSRFSQQALHQAAAEQLTRWQEKLLLITYEPGFRLSLPTPALARTLRQHKPFRQATSPLATDQQVWVGLAEAPRLWRYLQRLGYRLAPVGSVSASRGGLELPAATTLTASAPGHPLPIPALHQALPLPALLTLVRTYRELRRRVPGLAGLCLNELEQAMVAALPEQERTGVEQLVASNLHRLDQVISSSEAGFGQPAGLERHLLRQRLEVAASTGAALELCYADTDAQVTRRRVRPLHLETRWGQEYLVAFCELRQDERRFRLDRIVAVYQ